jgi:hopanoid biosynthesis associated protein HpnK
VTADDFGQSKAANEAIRQAHQEGVLTCASLMVNGDAFDEAVAIAREMPRLGVGLHLCLLCGRSVLPPADIPGLVNAQGEFGTNPVRIGLRYFFRSDLRWELAREIRAQIVKFRRTGLVLDHINGHLNLHLHPVVLNLLLREELLPAGTGFRLTRDSLSLNLRLASGQWSYRFSHALIFEMLSRRARAAVTSCNWRSTRRVFGLLQNGHVTEDYALGLVSRLGPGDYELYSHPSLDKSHHELAALVSSLVKERLEQRRIQRIRYQDL